ncbi:MAG: hypothetical protein VB062_04675 [Christensenella sp.]|nr:hypothetical protein [Christensenella sp.]
MSDYIKREDALGMFDNSDGITYPQEVIQKALNAIPAADVVGVVRCKDCDYGMSPENGYESCLATEAIHQPDFYCALGKRKDGDA